MYNVILSTYCYGRIHKYKYKKYKYTEKKSEKPKKEQKRKKRKLTKQEKKWCDMLPAGEREQKKTKVTTELDEDHMSPKGCVRAATVAVCDDEKCTIYL